jgi:gliding motility-associated-like protein
MYKGLTILLACCAFFVKAQQVYMVSPAYSPTANLTADTLHLCSSDAYPILQADTYRSPVRISWYLNGTFITNNPVITPTQTGSYRLIAQDNDLLEEKIVVIDKAGVDCETIIPNVFTPNGDGKNDAFAILNIEHFPNSTLQVFSRWGRKVFESTNYRNDWDGSNLEDGTYYFILKRNDGHEFKGSVTILR